MRLCTTVACWILLGFLPLTAAALGLGNISLHSALNEPFKADIELQSVGKTDLDQLSVSLASVDTFERYGLDRPLFLSGFNFALDKTANGGHVIRVTSTAPIAEPFVSILVDLKWASGRLLREYTVLLDPPLYEDTPVQSTVKPAQTAAPTQTEANGTVARESQSAVQQPVFPVAPLATVTAAEEVADTAPTESEASDTGVVSGADNSAQNEMSAEQLSQEQTVPEPEAELVAELPADANADADMMAPITQAAAPEPQAVTPDISAAYTAQRGDTLWRISENRRAGNGLTNNQMMLAIFRANPEAFMGNINALKEGSILTMPAADAGAEMSAREATTQAKQQHAEWEGSKSDSVAAEAQPEPPEAEAQPEPPETETQASDGPRLQLVAPEEDLTTAGQGEDAGAASAGVVDAAGTEESIADANASERLLQIEDAEFKALQDRQAEATDADFADGSIIVEGIEEPAVSPFVDDAEPLADDSGVAAESQAKPDEVSPDASQVVSLPIEDTASSLLGKLLGSYFVWGGLALVLLLGLFLARRRSSPAAKGSARLAGASADLHDETLHDFADLPIKDEPTVALDVNEAIVLDVATPEEFSAPAPESVIDQVETAVLDYDDMDLLNLDSELGVPATDSSQTPAQLAAEDLEFVTQEPQSLPDDEPELPLEQTVSTGAPLNLDQADPVAEAEFHMAYGLYDQAAHLLVGALENEPDVQAYRVKLLEVYFVWENKDAFLEEATKLHATLNGETDADWNKVLILGQQLCPDAELFSGSTASAPTADSMDLELFGDGDADGLTEVDFTLGGTESQVLDEADFNFTVDADEGNAEVDDLAVTMESPTLNLDSPGFDAPTVDMDMSGETVESPILNLPDTASDTEEVAGLKTEVLDDPAGLDIDLSGLTELSFEAALDSSEPVLDIDSTLNQLDNTGEILTPLDMSKTIAEDWSVDVDIEGVNIPAEAGSDISDDDATVQSETSSLQELSLSDARFDTEGDTVEQQVLADGDSELALGTSGEATMTEVGTKLDLARAYMDMGDPDGARSILTEVTSEGNDSQQQEARQLLEELGE